MPYAIDGGCNLYAFTQFRTTIRTHFQATRRFRASGLSGARVETRKTGGVNRRKRWLVGKLRPAALDFPDNLILERDNTGSVLHHCAPDVSVRHKYFSEEDSHEEEV